MIFDKLENAKLYKGISARLDKALEVAASENFSAMEEGKYEVDSDNIFYMVQRYNTEPIDGGKLEAHRKYIDIQVIADGKEIIGFESLNDQAVDTEYDSEGDYVLYEPTSSMTKLEISKGQFCILWPEDLHMPCVTDSVPSPVTKVVIKVKV